MSDANSSVFLRYLNLLFPPPIDSPICTNMTTTIRVLSLAKDLRVICSVDAQPTDIKFRWTTNTSGDSLTDFTTDGLTSTLTLKPLARDQSEMLQCWASNVVGHNRHPCLFVFIPPTRPQPVTDCRIVNRTTTDLVIVCEAGSDGGLPQTFALEVFNNVNNELVLNVTASEPVFAVGRLTAKTSYTGLVSAVNDLGRSESIELRLQTLKLYNRKLSINHLTLCLLSFGVIDWLSTGFIFVHCSIEGCRRFIENKLIENRIHQKLIFGNSS